MEGTGLLDPLESRINPLIERTAVETRIAVCNAMNAPWDNGQLRVSIHNQQAQYGNERRLLSRPRSSMTNRLRIYT